MLTRDLFVVANLLVEVRRQDCQPYPPNSFLDINESVDLLLKERNYYAPHGGH